MTVWKVILDSPCNGYTESHPVVIAVASDALHAERLIFEHHQKTGNSMGWYDTEAVKLDTL